MAMTKRLLPVGIQDFADIRTRGFVYVDKTARAYELITGSGKAFFLSRPRRFMFYAYGDLTGRLVLGYGRDYPR
jgi:phosphoribosyl-AMP cyclohydrolase